MLLFGHSLVKPLTRKCLVPRILSVFWPHNFLEFWQVGLVSPWSCSRCCSSMGSHRTKITQPDFGTAPEGVRFYLEFVQIVGAEHAERDEQEEEEEQEDEEVQNENKRDDDSTGKWRRRRRSRNRKKEREESKGSGQTEKKRIRRKDGQKMENRDGQNG